jgi:hypothetical protein
VDRSLGKTTVVKSLSAFCFDLESGERGSAAALPFVKGAVATRPEPNFLDCGPGQWVTGIYGRYGALVDQLGLVCDTVRPAAPPKPQPPIRPIGKKKP